MKIKVGEYVRTKNGISKVIENVDEYVTDKQISVDFIGGMYHQVIPKNRVIKHSSYIIDLIEPGDVIKYKEIFETKANEPNILNLRNQNEVDNFKKCVEDKDIVFISVVTHEQFTGMEHKV